MGFNFYANILEEANVKVNPDPVDDIDIEIDTSVLDAQKKYIADKKAKADKRSEGQSGNLHNGFLIGIAYKQAYWEIGNFLGKQTLDKVKNQMENLKDDELLAEKEWEDFRRSVLGKGGYIDKKLNKIKTNKDPENVMTPDRLQLYQMWRLYFIQKDKLLTKVAMAKANRISYLANMLEKAVSKRPDGNYERGNFTFAKPNQLGEGNLSDRAKETIEKYGLYDDKKLNDFIATANKEGFNWEDGAKMDLDIPIAANILEAYYERMATVFYDAVNHDMEENNDYYGYPSWSVYAKDTIIEYLKAGDVLSLFKKFKERVMSMNELNSKVIKNIVSKIEEAIKTKTIITDEGYAMNNQYKQDEEKKGNNYYKTSQRKRVNSTYDTRGNYDVLDDDEEYQITENLFQRLS